MKKQRAFTLVELMITMAIIAILATAGIQAYTGYVKKSRDTARAEIAQNLNSSVMAYAASNGGNPPANVDQFTQFLASAGETFGGGSIGGGAGILLVDPVGGKEVCLDALGEATEPCRFDYTAYEDGTYAISYGVEHKSSTEENFYKTTNSVTALSETEQKDPDAQITPVEKYGVYIGSAPYIGQPSITAITEVPNGIDVTTPGITVAFRSLKMNAVVTSGGGVSLIATGYGPCDNHDQCVSTYCSIITSCSPGDPETGEGGGCSYYGYCEEPFGEGYTCNINEECESDNCAGGICAIPK